MTARAQAHNREETWEATMSDRETETRENHADAADEATRPAQSAALHESAGEGEATPQDATDDSRWDTEEHSEAPGPTGTG